MQSFLFHVAVIHFIAYTVEDSLSLKHPEQNKHVCASL